MGHQRPEERPVGSERLEHARRDGLQRVQILPVRRPEVVEQFVGQRVRHGHPLVSETSAPAGAGDHRHGAALIRWASILP